MAAVIVAVRDHRAPRRSGAPRSWDQLALVIGIVTLAWCVAVVLGARVGPFVWEVEEESSRESVEHDRPPAVAGLAECVFHDL